LISIAVNKKNNLNNLNSSRIHKKVIKLCLKSGPKSHRLYFSTSKKKTIKERSSKKKTIKERSSKKKTIKERSSKKKTI
jgi:hypothetical protein